jgi:hypothetical protein
MKYRYDYEPPNPGQQKNYPRMDGEPDSSYYWQSPSKSRPILFKSGASSSGYCSTVNFSDLARLQELTSKPLGYQHIKTVYLRQEPIYFFQRIGLTIIIVPSYARFDFGFGSPIRFTPIDGRSLGAIAIGDNTEFSLRLPRGSLLEMQVIEC